MEREKTTNEENGSPNPATEVGGKLGEDSQKPEPESRISGEVHDVQPTQKALEPELTA